MKTNLIYFNVLFFFGLATSLWSWPMESRERAKDTHTASTEQRTNQQRRASEEPQEADANATTEKWNGIINQPQYWLDEKENLTRVAQEDFTFWNEKAETFTAQSQQEGCGAREKEKLKLLAKASSQAAQKAEEFLQLLEIQESLINWVNNPPEYFQVNYEQADQARRERDEAWKKESADYQMKERSRTELGFRAQQLEQAQQANDRQQQNFVAQVANAAGNAGGVLTGFPEPAIATGGAVMATAGGVLGVMNQIVGLFRISTAQVFHEASQRIHQEYSGNLNESLENTIDRSKIVIELEEAALQQERMHSLNFAKKLNPDSNWSQHCWSEWHANMKFSWPETSIKKLQENMPRTQQMITIAWKKKINDLKKSFNLLSQERTETLATLNSSYKEAEQRVQETANQVTQLQNQLKNQQQEEINLQGNIQTLTAEIEILRIRNQKLLSEKQQELIKILDQQKVLNQKIPQTTSDLQDALDKKADIESHLEITSLGCYHFEEHHSPVHQLHRLKTRLETAQEALWHYWPEHDDDMTSRPYLHWPLPFPNDIKEESHEIDATLPLELEKQQEERGHRYLRETEAAIAQALNAEPQLAIGTPAAASPQNPHQELANLNSKLLNHYFQLREIDPSAAEQTPHAQRWNAYRAHLKFHEQADQYAHASSEEYTNTHPENETRSIASSLWHSLLGSMTPSQVNQQFQHSYQNEQTALQSWQEYVRQANEARVAAGEASFPEQAWAEADQKTLTKLIKRNQFLQEKTMARKMKDQWELLIDCLKAKRDSNQDLWQELIKHHPEVIKAQQSKETVLTNLGNKHEKILERWDKMITRLNGLMPEEEKIQQQVQQNNSPEEKRLIQLERLWENMIEAQKQKRLAQAQEAATAYHEEGATFLWNHLPESLRQEYNHWVTEKNLTYSKTRGKAARARDTELLAKIQKQLGVEKKNLEKIWHRMGEAASGTLQATKDFVKQAEKYCQQRKEELALANKKFELGQMTQQKKNEDLIFRLKKTAKQYGNTSKTYYEKFSWNLVAASVDISYKQLSPSDHKRAIAILAMMFTDHASPIKHRILAVHALKNTNDSDHLKIAKNFHIEALACEKKTTQATQINSNDSKATELHSEAEVLQRLIDEFSSKETELENIINASGFKGLSQKAPVITLITRFFIPTYPTTSDDIKNKSSYLENKINEWLQKWLDEPSKKNALRDNTLNEDKIENLNYNSCAAYDKIIKWREYFREQALQLEQNSSYHDPDNFREEQRRELGEKLEKVREKKTAIQQQKTANENDYKSFSYLTAPASLAYSLFAETDRQKNAKEAQELTTKEAELIEEEKKLAADYASYY